MLESITKEGKKLAELWGHVTPRASEWVCAWVLGKVIDHVLRRTWASRRRVRYNYDDEDEEDEEYGYDEEIAMLEIYSQSARDEALMVRALVDEEEAEVLIFRGFSSSLSYRTSPDPSRSILPARAVIKSIDRVRGPFDPSNIEYLEKGLTWDAFKSRLQP
ncbi:hypothetical protein RHGRI_011876 [Rhododendron griersonianum]|uniref:DUF7734 domain-containing protein n=1 Tax=Rhododendron griersonianum TaxID=479676 RepID=A0AAV6KNS5_9ERIC|nr:hypothetical protein RHGRI_011876 [Rhododendron griersonianum]